MAEVAGVVDASVEVLVSALCSDSRFNEGGAVAAEAAFGVCDGLVQVGVDEDLAPCFGIGAWGQGVVVCEPCRKNEKISYLLIS